MSEPFPETTYPMPDAGDQVLVDTALYGSPGSRWCTVRAVRPGDMFPVKVWVPESPHWAAFDRTEIQGWRPGGKRSGRSREGVAVAAQCVIVTGLALLLTDGWVAPVIAAVLYFIYRVALRRLMR